MRKLLVVAGDGIGPEVTEAALYVMDGLGLDFELFMEPVGMTGIQERGAPMGDDTLALAREADAILFGAVESPPSSEPYRSPLLTLRRELGLYANVRPARPLMPFLSPLGSLPSGKGIPPLDVVIVRENSEGLYAGRERDVDGGAVAERLVTRTASERIHRFAFRWAAEHGRERVTCVHKANVLRRSDGLFLGVFREVAASASPEIGHDDIHADAAAARLVLDPASLDVLVAPNLYGDILSDLAAALCGGLGMAPSANIGDDHALFEPLHGSAPDIAGQGIANPVGAILSAAMMLEHLGHSSEAGLVVKTVKETLDAGVATPDIGGRHTTVGFAEEVRSRL